MTRLGAVFTVDMNITVRIIVLWFFVIFSYFSNTTKAAEDDSGSNVALQCSARLPSACDSQNRVYDATTLR